MIWSLKTPDSGVASNICLFSQIFAYYRNVLKWTSFLTFFPHFFYLVSAWFDWLFAPVLLNCLGMHSTARHTSKGKLYSESCRESSAATSRRQIISLQNCKQQGKDMFLVPLYNVQYGSKVSYESCLISRQCKSCLMLHDSCCQTRIM